jgi:hypothetical protein
MVSHWQRKQQRRKRRLQCETLEPRCLLTFDMAAASAWQSLGSLPPSPSGAASYLALDAYAAWQLDAETLRAQLAAAPLEFTTAAAAPLTFSVPTPTGEFARFALVESPLMASELAALFPEIRTYAGQGIDDPAATIRLDFTPQGFHAQVLSPNGVYYVDPYYHLENQVHVSYFRSDVNAAARRTELGNLLSAEEHLHSPKVPAVVMGPLTLQQAQAIAAKESEGESISQPSLLASREGTASPPQAKGATTGSAAKGGTVAQARSGTQLRTYRAAVAATAEYTAFHGGTVPLGQAAVVTAMNRVTGVYESELSIRFTLVANNNVLIFTNAANDPYTNNDPEALLDENQATIDFRIGDANYDIGHVFSTGGGGLAAPGVGIAGWKAQGETGSPTPTGDSFYIDYVVHEMGHQFDANHSWSGTIGSCSAANYASATGTEPGSGTTIMSYAGICGPDNVATNADPQFHAINFDEIINYAETVIPTVGTRSATGNSVPTVNAGSDYVIPTGTPFTLIANGSDADVGDALTYSWEQMDSGAQRRLSDPDNGTSALFRSRPPIATPGRTFPPLNNILANTNVPGETLPTVGRTLDFRVTVRDNRAGGGGVNTDDARVQVVNTGAPFRVTAPNTAVHWAARSTQLVTWNVAGTNANGINAGQVNILLSTDGGLTFPQVLASATPNDGAHLVEIPALGTSTTARIRIEPVGNIFFDVSDVNFFIDAAAAEQTDFGDAPDPLYATLLASDGPRHAIGGPRLGSFVDGEANGQTSATASGDGSDDDGVAISPLVAGQNFSIRVNASAAGAKLDYFFDFDGNGTFGNAANEVFSATLAAGTQVLTLPVPASAVAGNTFARFRISSSGGLGPTGAALDGEVEDYAVTIFASPPILDFGDAPASYSTTATNVGAAHLPGGPRLGTALDAELEGAATAMSIGDGADEDGVKFLQLLVPGSSANISVTASAAGMLNYFFDFDGSGNFADNPNEAFQAAVVAGVNTLSVPVPPAAFLGNFAARFRISTAGNLSPYGFAPDGEVEDYQVRTITTAIATPFQNFDSVTPPFLPAGWTSSSTTTGGPRNWVTVNTGSDTPPNHVFVPAASYTSTNRLTAPPFVLTTANQQLRFRHSYDHEYLYDGGVLEISTNGTTFTDFVSAGGTFISGGYASFLEAGATIGNRNAWSGSSSGYFETTLLLPASMLGQTVTLRWIEGTDSSFGMEGWRLDSLQSVRTALAFDYGDAPAPYPTLSSNSGAAHAQETALRLGVNFDVEINSTGNADADDNNGIDDEDGVTLVGTLPQGGTGNVIVVASGPGLLQGWIDFNDDGDWNDVGEQVFLDQLVAAGTNNLSFPVGPGAVVTAQTFARFRVSSQSGLAATGQAPDGEVEDYQVSIVAGTSAFVVSTVTTTNTGVVIDFNREFNRQQLNLYDAAIAPNAADLTLSGATAGNIRGSVILDANNRRLTFISTAGLLPPDTYTLTLRSAADGFRDTGSILLDGDANGVAGGDYVTNFTVIAPAANAVTLSLPNFARGPQQAVNIPANATTGLPISFSNGGGITSASFELRYNPALLTISAATAAPGMPIGANAILTFPATGVARVQFASLAPLAAGTTRFVDLQVSVPTTATYQVKQLLDLGNIVLNGGAIPGVDDDAVQVVGYFGDVTANGTYSGTDASYVARLTVGIDTGLAAYPLLDPVIIGDITGNGAFSSLDTSYGLQAAVGIDVAEVPPLPFPAVSLVFGGPDPKLSIPTDLVGQAGEELIIPVNIDSIVDLTGNGLESGELIIYYDARVLEVKSVVLGSLLSGRNSWFVNSRIDDLAGRVIVSVAGLTPLAGRFAGELVQLQAKVKADAPLGTTSLNLAASSRSPAISTQLNEGFLTLIPAPTDAANDPGVDGKLTIIASDPLAATATLINNQLLVIGTLANDRILVSEPSNGQVRVRVGQQLLGDFVTPDVIVIDGRAGQDYIVAATQLPTRIVASEDSADPVFGGEQTELVDFAVLDYLANWQKPSGSQSLVLRRLR